MWHIGYVFIHLLGELVWDDPCDGLTFDLCLVVDPLDGEEDLSQRPGLDDVMHELNRQPFTVKYHMRLQEKYDYCTSYT